ncbi:MAG TPA: hypothetical protein VNO21_22560 [Polyangiaceae bacterium]|nr:hypothetical protein [Polyangiaceae bacterium]
MNQLTIRMDQELEREIRLIARREKMSLNKAALQLLRRGAGLETPKAADHVIGDKLDDLIGTWSDSETNAVRDAVRVFDAIDDDLWR